MGFIYNIDTFWAYLNTHDDDRRSKYELIAFKNVYHDVMVELLHDLNAVALAVSHKSLWNRTNRWLS